MLYNAQIVGDEEIGQAVVSLQVFQQVDDLGLHRHIQRRCRLVQHNQIGLQGQRARDRDPLALAARQLVGEARKMFLAQPHQLQQIDNPFAQLLGGEGAMGAQRLGHRVRISSDED